MGTGDAEFEKVIEITDRLIAWADPVEIAFWLGYRHGAKHRLLGIDSPLPPDEHRCFIEVAEQGHTDKFIDAYAHGYQNGIDGRSPCEVLVDREVTSLTETTKLRRINGCSVCKHETHAKEHGQLAAETGKSFWCKHFNRSVDWKEGVVCPEWTCD